MLTNPPNDDFNLSEATVITSNTTSSKNDSAPESLAAAKHLQPPHSLLGPSIAVIGHQTAQRTNQSKIVLSPDTSHKFQLLPPDNTFWTTSLMGELEAKLEDTEPDQKKCHKE